MNNANITTPEETPMPDKTYIPEPGDIVRWHAAGFNYAGDPIEVLAVAGKHMWAKAPGSAEQPVTLSDDFSGWWEKITPKEAWETPAQESAWACVDYTGKLASREFESAASALQYGGHPARIGIMAVVQYDVIPRLDTLKKVER